ncbi:MAG: pyridoxal-phosphate dependent enzyme [Ahrensia sp.]|nr:pyridoxal-phosphate dependent enzyme [Ahrensia sp.]
MRQKTADGTIFLKNALQSVGLPSLADLADGEVETDARAARALFALCPHARATPLLSKRDLATQLGVAALHVKDERERMGLGSFKALGAVHAIAKMAAEKRPDLSIENAADALVGHTFICASAGNHGLSLAAGARLFGAQAVVVLAKTVPDSFAQRLETYGARVMRAGDDYEQSMEASKSIAAERDFHLLSDGSWLGYSDPARDVMEGYLIMGAETAERIDQPPTHVFLQAGVGGLAAAMAASARSHWGDDVSIIVVEPVAAPALFESVEQGRVVETAGPVSSMGRLDCKTPSHLALRYLAREADHFMLVSDEQAQEALEKAIPHGLASTPSGIAGLAGLMAMAKDPDQIGLTDQSRCLCILSEQV